MAGKATILRLAALGLLSLAQVAHAILPIQRWETSNGARVYFVESPGLPILDVSVEFPAGSVFDTPSRSGLAAMTSRLLRLGADGLSEDEIAKRFADVGAQLSGRFDTDRAGLTLRTLSSATERRQALRIFGSVLHKPEFPRAVLEREKKRVVGAVKDADTKPDTIADRQFQQLIFRDHPYALRMSGEAETVGKLAPEELLGFYRRHYAARYAVVAMIGDITRKEAEAIAEEIARGLPQTQDAEPVPPPVADLAAGQTRMIPHPATQSHIMIGAPGIRRGDPDYFPLFVGNFVLGGGGLISRINIEVRQKRGLAYSAYSHFAPLLGRGPFTIGMQTQRARTTEALEVARGTLRDFVENGPTEQELDAAKRNIIGSFPLRIDTNRKILDNLAALGFYRLPLTYLEDFANNVDRVTAADVRNAFKRRVDPDRMVTVVVGADTEPGR